MKYEKKINKGQDSFSVEISHSDDQYQVHYLVLGRTNITAAEKKNGAKKKRYIKKEECFYLKEITDDALAVLPNTELKAALDSTDVILSTVHSR